MTGRRSSLGGKKNWIELNTCTRWFNLKSVLKIWCPSESNSTRVISATSHVRTDANVGILLPCWADIALENDYLGIWSAIDDGDIR